MNDLGFSSIEDSSKVFLVSDTHFYHANAIDYCNRPFNNYHEMNQCMIEKWNSIVTDRDIVFFLGDFALGQCDKEQTYKDLSVRLHGTIVFLKGNHDRSAQCLSDYFHVIPDRFCITCQGYNFILTHKPLPYSEIPKGYTNIHGHIHDIVLGERVRDYKNPDNIIFYGKGCHKNVSVDVTNFEPISLMSIIDEIERGILKPKN